MEVLNKILNYFMESEMLNSKKFRAFIGGLIVLLLENYGVTHIDPEIIDNIVYLVLGYMGFQGGVDMVKAYAGYYDNR